MGAEINPQDYDRGLTKARSPSREKLSELFLNRSCEGRSKKRRRIERFMTGGMSM